jgi:tetratricopeptide (TPR) repeat protein
LKQVAEGSLTLEMRVAFVVEQSGSGLQHPRRSLGNRHRAQAKKFLQLAKSDPEMANKNLAWAEQAARQSVLHDFTHEANWTILSEVKLLLSDSVGLRAVLEDLFTILGRDPEQLKQLGSLDMLSHGGELLNAALDTDPLDPDAWWTVVGISGIPEFESRVLKLDLSDPRANILFGRRMERVRPVDEEAFIRLVRRLLAHRPMNHEAWIELGLLHEKRGENDDAWFSYDQAQTHFPQIPARDNFRKRMEKRIDGVGKRWQTPDADTRELFLERMESLAMKVATPEMQPEETTEEGTGISDDEKKLRSLIQADEFAAAFFLARRLVTAGDAWAQPYLDQAQLNL